MTPRTKRRVTVKDVAAKAGVSPALVSFVMCNEYGGGQYKVHPDTYKRVLEVARELDYRPNTSAKALRSGHFNTIGVIVSDISNPFFSEIARILENVAYEHNFSVIFGSTDEKPEKFRQVVEVFLSKGVDGMIIVPCTDSDSTISSLSENQMPMVLIDRTCDSCRCPSVLLDNSATSYDLTAGLVRKGFRRIEMISYDLPLSNYTERESGYEACMRDEGLSEYARIRRVAFASDRPVFDSIIRESKAEGVEAFVFATNMLATQCMTAIFRAGLRIPQDFGIACFDKSEAFDIYPTDLLYARQPLDRFATESIGILFRMLDGDLPIRSESRIVLKAEICDTSI